MQPLQIPNFDTLDQYPSWLNLKGGIDRSVCVEVKLAELRKLAGCVEKLPRQRGQRRAQHITRPLPGERPAHRKFADNISRLCTGIITINAEALHNLHITRLPRRLAGDFRTSRANVMRTVVRSQKSANEQSAVFLCDLRDLRGQSKSNTRFKTRITRANPFAFPADRGLDGNPNAGAARTKMIGLPEDWQQSIRLEKWSFPDRIQPAYFIICPGHDHSRMKPRIHTDESDKEFKNSIRALHSRHPTNHPCSSVSIRGSIAPAPLSTRPPGRLDPASSGGACPQRCLKLLMVQCTPEEYRDAKLAQLWIDSLPERLRLRSPYREYINKLIARYGILFAPRLLLCPRCVGGPGMGVRYGNNPETTRQGWRRRHGKPDTSIKQQAESIKQKGGRATPGLTSGKTRVGGTWLSQVDVPLSGRARADHEISREKIRDARDQGPESIRRKPPPPFKSAQQLQQRAAYKLEYDRQWRRKTRARRVLESEGLGYWNELADLLRTGHGKVKPARNAGATFEEGNIALAESLAELREIQRIDKWATRELEKMKRKAQRKGKKQ